MWASGVCQRIISDTILGIRCGAAFTLSSSPGYSFMASTPPEIEFRVVSLPPTMSSSKLPRNSMGAMCLVDSPWASIEIKSLAGADCWRSSHNFVKYSRHSINSARRCSWVSVNPIPGGVVATSLHLVSLRRSSNGKSNSVANIWVVSSTDTRSTQSNDSSKGRLSKMAPARSRISPSSTARFLGATTLATVARCTSCFGGSMAMNIPKPSNCGRDSGPCCSDSVLGGIGVPPAPPMVIPPAEEKRA